MKQLETLLARLKEKGERAFMPFLIIGDPDLETSSALAEALLRAGADILEFGLAFSDPPADGPVIQAAGKRALQAGITTDSAFAFLEDLRLKTEAPFALLVYYNLVLSYGVDRFFQRAAAVGIEAILIADLPLEEAGEALAAAHAQHIAPIFIVSEQTSSQRLAQILQAARGYLYLVTRLGVTGQQQEVNAELATILRRLKQQSPLPIFVGFGLSDPDHVRRVIACGADGAICGSAIVSRIEQHLHDRRAMLKEVESFCRAMKQATVLQGAE